MGETVLKCKQCGADVELTDAIAAPLIEAARLDFDRKLREKDAEIARQTREMESRRKTLEVAEEAMNETIAEQVASRVAQVSSDEAKKARALVQTEISSKNEELENLKAALASTAQLEARKARAAARQEVEQQKAELEVTRAELNVANDAAREAKSAQADYTRKVRELEAEKRALALTVQQEVSKELETSRASLRVEIEGGVKMKLREKDIQLESMKTEIENLKRKSEQGSTQIQGDAQEQELVDTLKVKFPRDDINRVRKGEFGGDCVQEVYNGQGKLCGTILWESKRTKSWDKDWLAKLKSDQHAMKADVAIIVSQVLPKGVELYEQIGEVWVAGLNCIVPVAGSLRHLLIETAATRRQNEGQRDKAALIYQYVTSVGFRQRVKEMTEAYTIMKADLHAEQKAIRRQWAKREKQLERMMDATTGISGDLQGIAGKSMPEIDGMSFDLLGTGS